MKILKFGAVWCPGCLVMRPRWQEIEQEMPELETQYIEYDSEHPLVHQYKIDEQLPVFVFLNQDGEEIARLQGEVSKNEILTLIHENTKQ